ncbi:hypothetical protein E3V55_03775 [Candidatus Marinimicrobia bacterium MT.SAG.3]|nr:hypothetical protein E3V55_03775 [Candidatus Marinimicrobia bacterium MT.SAG.3]
MLNRFLFIVLLISLVTVGCEYSSQPETIIDSLPQQDAMLSASLAKAAAGGRVFIVFDDKADPDLVESLGGRVVYSYQIVPAVAATAPGDVISQLAVHPRVVRIEPDGKVHAIDAELDNTWGVKRIGAGIVHDGGNKGSGVKIGIIDSGTDYTHPDLDGNFDPNNLGRDFVNDDDYPMDDNGHGTHVAGTIAAEDDGVGVVGVAPEASLYALKVLNSSGSGNWSDIIAALDWAVANGIQVTNNSYGSSNDPGSTVEAAFENSAAAGILHVAAAGNAGNPPGRGDNVGYPAVYGSVIAVAATNQDDNRASFSSTGSEVELSAPGVKINSTKLGGGYVEFNGTSMASPHVAGTAALVIAAGISNVRAQLQTTADDLGVTGRDPLYGYGLVDADEAAGSPPPPSNDPPTVSITSPADGSTFDSGATINFAGTANDTEDGDLTANLVWTSSIDGQIGTGGSFSTTTLSDGDHTISAEVTDSGGEKASASIGITVGAPAVNNNDIYVWAIDFSEKHYGRGGSKTDLMTIVTIHRDSDGDGVAEDADEPTSQARVEMKLSKSTDESWNFAGDTGSDGSVTFTLKSAPNGTYTATVTNVTHGTYVYNFSLNVETSDTHIIQ